MMKYLCSLTCLSFLMLGCSNDHVEPAKSYATLAEAQAAINFENEKIDDLIAQIRYVQSDRDKKTLMCERIPQQYDKVTALMDANQHLMTASDQLREAEMRRMITDQKAKFLNSRYCSLKD